MLTLLVRDEEDVIEANLAHHLSIGVDHIIVCDNRSTDATPAIVHDIASRTGAVTLLHEDGDDYAQARWVSDLAARAFADHGADWVIHADGDELVHCLRGSLPDALAAQPRSVSTIMVPRLEFRPVADVSRPFHERMTVRPVRAVNALGHPLSAKVCHRGAPRVTLTQGNHAVLGLDGQMVTGGPLVMFHYPLRHYAQFERKVRLGGEAYLRNRELSGAAREPWATLYTRLRAGRLRAHYDARVLDADAVTEGIGAGRLVRDHRMATTVGDEVEKLRHVGTMATHHHGGRPARDAPSPSPAATAAKEDRADVQQFPGGMDSTHPDCHSDPRRDRGDRSPLTTPGIRPRTPRQGGSG